MNEIPYKSTENGTISKPRKAYKDMRPREFLHRHEVESLIDTALLNKRGGGLHALMISMAFNHALRATELVDLTWEQIDLKTKTVYVNRIKGSVATVHHLTPAEVRGLKKLKEEETGAGYVFITERKQPMSIRGFHKMIADYGVKAKFAFPIHPHMLRHAKGYDLANRGVDCRLIQDYLGHANIQNTVRYTKIAPERLKGLES